jgi:hypothetical protein
LTTPLGVHAFDTQTMDEAVSSLTSLAIETHAGEGTLLEPEHWLLISSISAAGSDAIAVRAGRGLAGRLAPDGTERGREELDAARLPEIVGGLVRSC